MFQQNSAKMYEDMPIEYFLIICTKTRYLNENPVIKEVMEKRKLEYLEVEDNKKNSIFEIFPVKNRYFLLRKRIKNRVKFLLDSRRSFASGNEKVFLWLFNQLDDKDIHENKVEIFTHFCKFGNIEMTNHMIDKYNIREEKISLTNISEIIVSVGKTGKFNFFTKMVNFFSSYIHEIDFSNVCIFDTIGIINGAFTSDMLDLEKKGIFNFFKIDKDFIITSFDLLCRDVKLEVIIWLIKNYDITFSDLRVNFQYGTPYDFYILIKNFEAFKFFIDLGMEIKDFKLSTLFYFDDYLEDLIYVVNKYDLKKADVFGEDNDNLITACNYCCLNILKWLDEEYILKDEDFKKDIDICSDLKREEYIDTLDWLRSNFDLSR